VRKLAVQQVKAGLKK